MAKDLIFVFFNPDHREGQGADNEEVNIEQEHAVAHARHGRRRVDDHEPQNVHHAPPSPEEGGPVAPSSLRSLSAMTSPSRASCNPLKTADAVDKASSPIPIAIASMGRSTTWKKLYTGFVHQLAISPPKRTAVTRPHQLTSGTHFSEKTPPTNPGMKWALLMPSTTQTQSIAPIPLISFHPTKWPSRLTRLASHKSASVGSRDRRQPSLLSRDRRQPSLLSRDRRQPSLLSRDRRQPDNTRNRNHAFISK